MGLKNEISIPPNMTYILNVYSIEMPISLLSELEDKSKIHLNTSLPPKGSK